MTVLPLYLDTESHSPTPLAHGLYRYAEEVDVMLVTYAIGEGPIKLWDRTTGVEMPGDLALALDDPDVPIIAHNAQFDRTVMRMGARIEPELTRWRCSMVRAWSCGLPGALGDLAPALGLPADEQKIDGKRFINLFCKPNKKGERNTRETHPAEWALFCEYAKADIGAMRAALRRMPLGCWAPSELAVWHEDQRINDTGFPVDLALVNGAIEEVEQHTVANNARATELTDGAVDRLTKRDALLKHLVEAFGVTLPDLKSRTIEKRLDDPDLPDDVKELLRLRLMTGKASVSKYKAVLRAVSSDGRLRGTLQYAGASRTLRWAGRIFQPQNLPRPTWLIKGDPDNDRIRRAIDLLVKRQCWLEEDPIDAATNALRGVIVAPSGESIQVSDLSNIEGRVAAWVAGEEWKLQAFREYDAGVGPDLYVATYAKAFSVPISAVDKQKRQVGKVIELACGYQGWIGAYSSMAEIYGVHVVEAEAKPQILAWREAHPKISGIWPALEYGVRRAMAAKGLPIKVGSADGGVILRVKGSWLSVTLPSGRSLYYPKPRVEETIGRGGHVKYHITFKSVNRYTKKWEWCDTYGGKLFENIVQAIARDILALGLLAARRAGLTPILSVHDEILALDNGAPDGTLTAAMTAGAAWTKSLPLSAAGSTLTRYQKD